MQLWSIKLVFRYLKLFGTKINIKKMKFIIYNIKVLDIGEIDVLVKKLWFIIV